MIPFFQEAGQTIYCGDNRDVLPLFPKCGLLLTDPPYGLSWNSASAVMSITPVETDWDKSINIEHLQVCISRVEHSIIWGGNYHGLGAWRTPLIWNKNQRGTLCADGEIAWTNFDFGMLRIFDWTPGQEGTRGEKLHPTEKPVALMKWCIKQVDIFKYKQGSLTILDPFMGSGTTLIAAREMGREAIGIECNERYCEIAAKRLAQKVFEWQ